MRTVIEAHELLPKGMRLESLGIETGRVSISMSSGSRKCVCPSCGRDSSRVHSRYSRTVSDLPWHGVSVELEVRARRFFCDEASCARRIFCERLPDVAARARKTPNRRPFSFYRLRSSPRRRPSLGPGGRKQLAWVRNLGASGGAEVSEDAPWTSDRFSRLPAAHLGPPPSTSNGV